MSSGRRSAPERRGRLMAWIAWFAALNLLWLVFISAFVLEETILGLFASALAATAVLAVRAQGLAGFRVRARWFWHVRFLPGQTVRESAFVLAALGHRLTGRPYARGRFRLVRVALPEERDEQAAKRALLTAGRSFPPNSYVIAIDPDRRVMLTHELVPEETE